MKTTPTKLGAFLTGFGSAFALFPTAHLAPFIARESIQARIYNNFRAAGERIQKAQNKVADEQAQQAR